jgi:tRNA uridine 5-carbamoylmethylation protein Kti12
MKIILCTGLPASGKSTWARAQLERSPDRYKRVNRDELRVMIDNGKWSRSRERLIKLAEQNLAELFFTQGYTVIVDDCNLAPSARTMWSELARKLVAELEVQDFTDVPLQTCLERDRERPNSVGERVIRRMYRDYLAPASSGNAE